VYEYEHVDFDKHEDVYQQELYEEMVEPPSSEFGNDNVSVEYESFYVGLTPIKVLMRTFMLNMSHFLLTQP